jgi:hypothetical protein
MTDKFSSCWHESSLRFYDVDGKGLSPRVVNLILSIVQQEVGISKGRLLAALADKADANL